MTTEIKCELRWERSLIISDTARHHHHTRIFFFLFLPLRVLSLYVHKQQNWEAANQSPSPISMRPGGIREPVSRVSNQQPQTEMKSLEIALL